MAEVTRYPTTDTAISGTWTAPTAVQADDGTLASVTPGAKNTTHERGQGGYGFDTALPSDAIIDNVFLEVEWSTTGAGINTLGVQSVVGGTPDTSQNNAAEPTSLTAQSFEITSLRAWTRTNLLNANFGTRLRAINGNNTSGSYSFDYVRVRVVYHQPPAAINTDYHVSFPTPTGTITGQQTFRAHVYVDGAGAPTGALYLYESGVQIGSALWSDTVTGTEASPATISGTWDAAGRTAANIEARFTTVGVSGGTARLYSVEWNAQVLDTTQTLNITGIASSEAIGQPALDQQLAVSGIVSEEVIGAPELSQAAGGLTLNIDGIASAEVVGSPGLNQTVSPTGITSQEALGQPALNQVLAPTGIASQETMGAPSLSAASGSQNLAVSGIASQEALGQPVLNRTVDLNSGLIPDTGLVPDVGLAPDAYEGIGSEQTIGRPSLTQSAPAGNTLNITGIASQEAVGSPTLNQTLSPSSIGTQEALGGPALAQRISPTGIASQEVTGQPGLNQQVSVQGIASEEMTGQPSLTYPQSLQVSGIASQEAIGSPVLDQAGNPNQNLQITGIASAESVGQPGLSQTVAPSGIASGESIGQPGLIQDQSLQVSGIPSSEAVGQPTIHLRVNATGIASQEVLGSVSLTQGEPPAGLPLVVLGIPSGETIGVPVVWLGDVPLPPGPITGTVGFDPNMKSTVSAAIALGGSNVGRQLVGKVNVQRPVKRQVRVDDLNSNESYNSGGG